MVELYTSCSGKTTMSDRTEARLLHVEAVEALYAARTPMAKQAKKYALPYILQRETKSESGLNRISTPTARKLLSSHRLAAPPARKHSHGRGVRLSLVTAARPAYNVPSRHARQHGVFSAGDGYDDTMVVPPALGMIAYLHVPEMDAAWNLTLPRRNRHLSRSRRAVSSENCK